MTQTFATADGWRDVDLDDYCRASGRSAHCPD